MIRYRIPPGVRAEYLKSRPVLATSSGGRVVVDYQLLQLWEAAEGRDLDEILTSFKFVPVPSREVRAALACLAEAGLLLREGDIQTNKAHVPVEGELVSAVIVGYNSREWLETCLSSLKRQNYSPIEIILVDNASTDGTLQWLKENYPGVPAIHLENPRPLAEAINLGVRRAEGAYFLILNPDVWLEPDAVSQMVAVAGEDPTCAAVAAKLKFSWAPAFLNGLGSFVGAISWGTDIGLGHLDLGQFDSWREVPSACFAGALIPRPAWEQVGEVDDQFPLYYEDSEWSYRARLIGWHVSAAPGAVIYHAFSGRIPSGADRGLGDRKLRQVVYGRLRFASKLLDGVVLWRFLAGYFIEDFMNGASALFKGRWRTLGAVLGGWRDYLHTLPALRIERGGFGSRRRKSAREVFRLQEKVPVPLIWHGLPLLTWDIIRHHYLPLMVAGGLHPLPEFSGILAEKSSFDRAPVEYLERARQIWRLEGFGALLHRMWKHVQRRLQV